MAKIDKVTKTVGYNLRVEKSELKMIEQALLCYMDSVVTQIQTEDDDYYYKDVEKLHETIKNFNK